MSIKSLNAIAMFVVLAIGLAVYIRATTFEFVELDDPLFVVENPYVNRGLSAESVIWAFTFKEVDGVHAAEGVSNVWAPLTFLSHGLDVELWGLNPRGHHLTNVILHLMNTCLALGVFYLLGRRVLIAVLVAAVFCFHPMRVESVAWISERKDVLSGFFIFLCLILYTFWASPKKNDKRGTFSSQLFYFGSLAAFLAGCLSKPTTVFLPGILALVDVWPLRRFELALNWTSVREFLMRQASEKWPFLIVVVAVSGFSIVLQHSGSHQDFMSSLGLKQRIFEMPALILFYLERTFLPVDLFPDYPRYPHAITNYSVVAVVLLVGIAVLAWRVRQACPSLLFGWIWFVVCLVPVVGLIYVGPSFSSDRYTYIAHCGLAFALAAAMNQLVDWRPRLRAAVLIFGSSIIAAMALLSFGQVEVWRDTGNLYRHGVRAQPGSTTAWNNLGAYHMTEGRAEEALECIRSALRIREGYDVYYNLGLALRKTGAPPVQQIEAFRNSIRVYPNYLPALRELGLMLTDRSVATIYNPDEACRHLERACDLLDYEPTENVTDMVQRLLTTLDEIGDREGYDRVLTRAKTARVLHIAPAP